MQASKQKRCSGWLSLVTSYWTALVFTGEKKGASDTVVCAETATNTLQFLWSVISEGSDGLFKCRVSSILLQTSLSWQPGHPLGSEPWFSCGVGT